MRAPVSWIREYVDLPEGERWQVRQRIYRLTKAADKAGLKGEDGTWKDGVFSEWKGHKPT